MTVRFRKGARRGLAVLVAGVLFGATGIAGANAKALPKDATCGSLTVIQAQIRERIDYYAFLVDGWSPSRTRKEWAEDMFTKEAVLEGYDTAGKKILDLRGRAAILASFDRQRPPRRDSNHFIPNTYFEATSCDRVVTHSKGFSLTVAREGGKGPAHRVFLYRDEWVREEGKWRKQLSQVRYID